MRLDITGRHVDITPDIRELIDKRLVRLGRLLNDSAISAQVILTKEKYRHRTEIVVHARGDRTLRGRGEGTGWPAALRQSSEKIEQQAQKVKGKWAERKRKGAGARTVDVPANGDAVNAGPVARIVRARRYPVKPMSVEDAALQVNADRESFVVFRNADTDAISILYRRKDGNLGLIEPD
jgi:ribosome hibernation promoting factor